MLSRSEGAAGAFEAMCLTTASGTRIFVRCKPLPFGFDDPGENVRALQGLHVDISLKSLQLAECRSACRSNLRPAGILPSK